MENIPIKPFLILFSPLFSGVFSKAPIGSYVQFLLISAYVQHKRGKGVTCTTPLLFASVQVLISGRPHLYA